MSDNKRYRNWCFTYNNYPTPPFSMAMEENTVEQLFGKFKYIVIGFEVGDSGTPHLQGYVDWVNARTLGGLKRICGGRIHWEPRQGTWDQAVQYCMKDGQYIEFGTPNEQGKRTDLVALKDDILGGAKVDDIALENPVIYHQYGRTLTKIEDLALRRNFRTEMTEGIWLWGRTGVGKSHEAFDGYTPQTHYLYPNDNGWWDGYTQQPTVIINDFRGEIPYNVLLQLIDKWPVHVRRRNREPMPFTSTKIIITSSVPPQEVYHRTNEKDNIQQLLRRLNVIELHDTRSSTEVLGGGNTESPPA